MIPTAGGPGSGKGSQCGRVAEVSGYQHLSTGDLLRQEVMAGTERWVRLFEVISSGQLAPDVSMNKNMVQLHNTVPAKQSIWLAFQYLEHLYMRIRIFFLLHFSEYLLVKRKL